MQPKDIVVLVTAVCGDIGSSVVRALSDIGYRLIGVDVNMFCPVVAKLEHFFQIPSASSEEDYINVIAVLCNDYGVNVIVPISEIEILAISRKFKFFKDIPVKLTMHSEEVLGVFFDKLDTVNYIRNLGYETPASIPLEEFAGQFPYPFIAKPRQGCGSKNVYVVKNESTLTHILSQHETSFLAQELIGSPAEEYTTGVFSDGQSCSCITFKRSLGYGGLSREVHLVDVPYLSEMAHTITKDLSITGCINIQSRKVGELFIPFEVNPRISSTVMFRHLFGFQDAHWWVQYLCGLAHTGGALPYGAVGIRRMEETVFLPKSEMLS